MLHPTLLGAGAPSYPSVNPPMPPLKKGDWAQHAVPLRGGTRFFAEAQNDTRHGGRTAVRPYEKSPYTPYLIRAETSLEKGDEQGTWIPAP